MIFGRRQRPRLEAGVSLWADRAGLTHLVDGSRNRFADPTDEVCYILDEGAGRSFDLAKRERDQEPVWMMSASDLDVVGRFLCVELAPAVRALDRLAPVLLAFDDEPREGWRIEQVADRLRVLDPTGAEVALLALEDPFGVSRASAFTRYARTAWADLFTLLTVDLDADVP